MNLILKLYHFFLTKVSKFKSNRKDNKIISKIRKATLKVRPETETLLSEIESKTVIETNTILNEIVESTTISEIAEVVSSFSNSKKSKTAISLHELETELNRLNKEFYVLEIKQRRIQFIDINNFNPEIDEKLSNLYSILNKHNNKGNVELLSKSTSSFEKSFKEFEQILQDSSTLSSYRKRELEKKRKEEFQKKEIQIKLGEVEMLINQNKLESAKIKISLLEIIIHNTTFNKEQARYEKVKNKFKEKEIANLKKIEIEILKLQNKKAEEIRLIETERKKKQDFETQFDFISDSTKDNVLDNYKIEYLYHMTDVSNIQNILINGLLSHNTAHNNGFNQTDIALQDVNQRRANKKPIHGIALHEFVPMYFNPKNPMLFRRKDLQNNIAIIAIDRRAIYQDRSIFSDGNAASDSTQFYNNIEDLDKLNWDCIKDDYWNNYSDGKRIKCAETLAYPKITTRHIRKIYCNNIRTKNLIDEQSPISKTYQVELNSKYFFNSNFNFEFSF